MTFAYVPPSPALREFVRDYLVAHFVFDGTGQPPRKAYAPKPEQGLTFFVRGQVRAVDVVSGKTFLAPPVTVFGQHVSRCDVFLPPEFLMVRVHFQPGALHRFLSVPLDEIPAEYCDAEALMGSVIRKTSDRLANCKTYREMLALIEEYLSRQIASVRREGHPLDLAVGRLLEEPARFSVAWLADQACLSPRQLGRKFRERMGTSPKLFSRLVRFHRACRLKESDARLDWLAVAVICGYTDYQHLVKDFKAFAHATPNSWLGQENSSPERVLDVPDWRVTSSSEPWPPLAPDQWEGTW